MHYNSNYFIRVNCGVKVFIQFGESSRPFTLFNASTVTEVGDIKTEIATITTQVRDNKKITEQVKQWKHMG